MFSISSMEKPIIVVGGVKFQDLCLILDFAYLGQAEVPHDRLDHFLKAGEILQIRGIKEGRIHFMTNQVQTVQQTTVNRSFDATISSTQETTNFVEQQPPTKRAREDDEPSIQEVSEIMKMLLENNPDLDIDQLQIKPASLAPNEPALASKAPQKPPVMQAQMKFMPPQSQIKFPPPIPVQMLQSMPPKAPEKPKYNCSFCLRSLSTIGRVRKHENECDDNPNREIAWCDLCNSAVKPSNITSHKKTKHCIAKSKSMSPQTQPLNDINIQMPLTNGAVANAASFSGYPSSHFNYPNTPHPSPGHNQTPPHFDIPIDPEQSAIVVATPPTQTPSPQYVDTPVDDTKSEEVKLETSKQ